MKGKQMSRLGARVPEHVQCDKMSHLSGPFTTVVVRDYHRTNIRRFGNVYI